MRAGSARASHSHENAKSPPSTPLFHCADSAKSASVSTKLARSRPAFASTSSSSAAASSAAHEGGGGSGSHGDGSGTPTSAGTPVLVLASPLVLEELLDVLVEPLL